jgi:carbon monoxide dehydrogenase subunit G
MLLAITKSVTLPHPIDLVWDVLSDPVAVAGCLPNVQDFRPAGEPGRFQTTLVERLGPFSVQVGLTIDVTDDAAGRVMVARIAGDDKGGAARVRGDVRAAVEPATDGAGVRLEVASNVEVLGRMATLGAGPMRRRGDQVFDQFVKNIASLLEERHG